MPLSLLPDISIAIYNLTTTTKAGGVESFTLGIAAALAKKGHTVHIYGGRGDVSDMPKGVDVFTYPYLCRNYVPNLGSRFRKLVERLSMGIFALFPLVRLRFDYIYIHKPYDLPVALLASLLSGAKLVFSSHGTEFYPGYRWMVKRLFRFFSCSRYNALDVERYAGVRPAVLYNGIDTDRFVPMPPDAQLIKRHSLDGAFVLISICRLVGWKGLQYAVTALSHMSSPVRYLVGGVGPYERTLRRLVSDLGIEDKVVFLGRLTSAEIPAYYSIAHAAIYPSVADETFGISIAEAMSCGVPVIAAAVGGIPEVVGDNTGLLIQPKDELAVVDAVDKLLRDEALRATLGRNARRWISDNFAWGVIAERFEREIGVSADA